ncbi:MULTISPECIES: hypothetical protein [Chryseobacterium]|uniref:DUF4019 domain-containing protein n=1 Tax=Chryseobacterium camelliae TaxID=1265445 RepID=A0ABU0TKG1_9FLAO|nr:MULTISPECIES: hypothetical protein [Chryseobacterium]MDT3408613.1 hypothetical protein [Pseudacidovorax intermedius]MDQ1097532.1 hypothetical protein [Chryseobacterium camelliae]MDQ1101461.1 hypothetical protein [Chryseobacterium sp. SORGH_AS_1048]MDR6084905.1 hypothetical protein [Chryseobacterium sp. SORGH_AS_0909]MDR6129257.1 hypothetical protein [Chryseobacterium sp. SORGH_AS_1175]
MKIYSILFLFFFLSCDFVKTYRENVTSDKEDAEKVTEKFYTFLKQNKKEEIFKLFNNEFYRATSKKDLDQIITWAIEEGKISSKHVLIDWKTHVEKGTDAKSEYLLTYNVQRGKIKTEEIFTLTKDQDDNIKIKGYRLNLENTE